MPELYARLFVVLTDLVCAYVLNLWIRMSGDSQMVPDLVIVPDTMFAHAQRQKEFEA